jgi:hypothetical protein
MQRHRLATVEFNDDPDANLFVICPHCGRRYLDRNGGAYSSRICKCRHYPAIRKDRCPCTACERARRTAGQETVAGRHRREAAERKAAWLAERAAYEAEHGPGSWAAMCGEQNRQFAAAVIREMGGDPATYCGGEFAVTPGEGVIPVDEAAPREMLEAVEPVEEQGTDLRLIHGGAPPETRVGTRMPAENITPNSEAHHGDPDMLRSDRAPGRDASA